MSSARDSTLTCRALSLTRRRNQYPRRHNGFEVFYVLALHLCVLNRRAHMIFFAFRDAMTARSADNEQFDLFTCLANDEKGTLAFIKSLIDRFCFFRRTSVDNARCRRRDEEYSLGDTRLASEREREENKQLNSCERTNERTREFLLLSSAKNDHLTT